MGKSKHHGKAMKMTAESKTIWSSSGDEEDRIDTKGSVPPSDRISASAHESVIAMPTGEDSDGNFGDDESDTPPSERRQRKDKFKSPKSTPSRFDPSSGNKMESDGSSNRHIAIVVKGMFSMKTDDREREKMERAITGKAGRSGGKNKGHQNEVELQEAQSSPIFIATNKNGKKMQSQRGAVLQSPFANAGGNLFELLANE